MESAWLTPTTARPHAESKIAQIRQALRSEATTVEHEEVFRALRAIRNAALDLSSSLFGQSVGIVFRDYQNDRETWYVCGSKSPAGYFADIQIIPWTHWIGNVATQLRNAVDRGEAPTLLKYGPAGKEIELPVGPLVEYLISEGKLKDLTFHSGTAAPKPEPGVLPRLDESPLQASEVSDDESAAYGLKPIFQTLAAC